MSLTGGSAERGDIFALRLAAHSVARVRGVRLGLKGWTIRICEPVNHSIIDQNAVYYIVSKSNSANPRTGLDCLA
jgi:hypothetical protein